jgi:hypothetical protein
VITAVVFFDDDITTVEDIITVMENTISNETGVDDDSVILTREKLESVTFGDGDKTGQFAYITSLDRKGKIQFLEELINAIQAYGKEGAQLSDYFNDMVALSAILAQLVLDGDEGVSGRALFSIRMMSWPHLLDKKIQDSGSNQTAGQLPADIPDISQSAEIKMALEQLISDDDTDDDFRGDAIEAYALLYPPEDTMINEFEKLIVAGGIDGGDTLTAIFSAYTHYKRIYDYDMPASTIEAAEKLIEHPSESVKLDALYALRKNVGKPILPVLFDQLKESQSMGVVNALIIDILSLDPSDETVRQLKEVAAERPLETGKVRLIERYTNAKNVENFRKISK